MSTGGFAVLVRWSEGGWGVGLVVVWREQLHLWASAVVVRRGQVLHGCVMVGVVMIAAGVRNGTGGLRRVER